MGASSSNIKAEVATGKNHGPIPEDPYPYPGPAWEYRVVLVNAKLKAQATFFPKAGKQITSCDIDHYLPILTKQYAEHFRMSTFLRVPMAQQVSGFAKIVIPFQGIYSRPVVFQASHESYSLHKEQTTIQLSLIGRGELFRMPQIGENVGGIFEIINNHSQRGGRLVCMEVSGDTYSQGMQYGQSPWYGVDIFFDVPQHPNPTIYTYSAFCAPMHISYGFGAVQASCDYGGILSTHLNQGWKLVDIFIAQQETCYMQGNNQRYRPSELNTIWFFEKETARLNDPTPLYQVTMITYAMQVSAGFGGAKAHFELGELLSEMGKRGWSLVCVLDTPDMASSGFGSAVNKVICFFQRPVINPAPGQAAMPMMQPQATAPSAMPSGQQAMGSSASAAAPPSYQEATHEPK